MVKLDLNIAIKAYSEWSSISDQYTSRINIVIRKICDLFSRELDWWDYTNCGHSGEEGHLTIDMIDSDTIQLQGNILGDGEMVALIYGSEWDFSCLEFPAEFLYYDFEEDLKKGIVRYLENKEVKQKKVKKSTKDLIKSAKAKLTKEELKALKLK